MDEQVGAIIEEGLKFKTKMSEWKQEEPCKVCEESWFDQDVCWYSSPFRIIWNNYWDD